VSAVAALLTMTGFLIVAVGAWCGFWIWLDAREAAAQRKHEADMADALQRTVQQARMPAKGTEPNRYLTSDDRSPE
jgi:hypothetical protein